MGRVRGGGVWGGSSGTSWKIVRVEGKKNNEWEDKEREKIGRLCHHAGYLSRFGSFSLPSSQTCVDLNQDMKQYLNKAIPVTG